MDELTKKLFEIVQEGDHEELERLAKAGVYLGVNDAFGATLIHEAARWGGLECLEVLLKNRQESVYGTEHGLDIDAIDRFGRTAAHLAPLWSDKVKRLEMLAKYGANLNVADNSGRTPKETALRYSRVKCAEFLNSL